MTRFRWTIKRKLLALGGATLLPLLLLLAFWLWWEAREHTEATEAELTLASQQAAVQVEALLQQVTRHLGTIARNPSVQRRDVALMEGVFRAVHDGHPELENVFALAADGRTVASAVPPLAGPPLNASDRPWFQRVMATGRPAVGDFQIGRLLGLPVAMLAVPVRDGGEAPAAVVVASLSLRRLHALFEPLRLGRGKTLTVVDAQGRVLSGYPAGAGGEVGTPLPSAADVPRGAVLKKLTWFGGGARIVAVAPIAGTGWSVLVGIPSASLEDRVWKEARAIALPLLGLLAVSGLVGLLIARKVWRPLEALTDAAARLPRGEAVSVDVDSTDEVGELGRAFNAMAAQIKESRSSIERRVAELEALSEAGNLLTSTLEISEVLQRLTDLVHTRLGADVVRIWLREGAPQEFQLAAHAGVTRQPGEYRMRLEPGEELVAWIMDRREPLMLADVETDPRLKNRDWIRAEDLHAFLGVPIVLEDAPVGVLVCMRRERRDFSPGDVALAQLFALPAAVAILNARLYDDARARAGELAALNRQLNLLHEAARSLTVEHDPDRLLQRSVNAAQRFLGAGYGALAVITGDGRIDRLFTAGITPEERERIGSLPEGRGLLAQVFKHGRTLRLDDLSTHPDAVGFPPGHPPMRTLLARPIRLRGEILGALYLSEKPGGFTAGDEALVSTLCADAAVAIDNARLVASLRQALEDLKATQDQLVRAGALRAVGELASGMAHHMNNILAVISGRVQLLLLKAEEPSLRHALEIVERAARNGAEVVRRVQAFSRSEPVRGTGVVDLNQLARDALELTRVPWRDEAHRRGMAIEASLEPAEIPAVAGDPGALMEVLVNVLLNAFDALPQGGRITVKAWSAGGQVHCSVTDTGAGMSDEVQRRALEPFFTTKGPKGQGLGLSVSHGIVQRHGGTLSVQSTPGLGTTVTISLPAAVARPAEAPAPVPFALSLRILVIDDEADVREMLADALADQGHLVSQAASGAEGLAMFEAERHDFVFTDLGMPEMNGRQVAQAMKTMSPGTPIVLVTGWGGQVGEAERATGLVDQVLAKPFDVDALAAVIARAWSGSAG